LAGLRVELKCRLAAVPNRCATQHESINARRQWSVIFGDSVARTATTFILECFCSKAVMIETQTCAKCGAGVSAGILDGLCSRCLAVLVWAMPSPRAASRSRLRARHHPNRTANLCDYELLTEIAHGDAGVFTKHADQPRSGLSP